MRVIRIVAAMVVMCGCSHTSPALKSDPQIAAVPSSKPPKKQSYIVNGELAKRDLIELERMVAKLTEEPILSISVTRPGVVEVTTGVVRGPLDGGGSVFEFEKQNGVWVQLDSIGFWVS